MVKMDYVGTELWQRIDRETGEIKETKEVNMFERPVGRNERFMVTYLSEIISLIDNLGNKKMQVLKYILQNMDKGNNTLIQTTTEIAKKSGVGFNTVIETLKILENADIVHRKTGAVMLRPKLVNNWRANKEATMMVKYFEFKKEKNES